MNNVRFLAGFILIGASAPLWALPPAPEGPYESLEDYRAWKMNDEASLDNVSNRPPEMMIDMPFQPIQSMPVWNWGVPSDPKDGFPGLSTRQSSQ